ncbi:peptide chain release factor N(5)-glutamine methyltransferase [Selenomonas caprae]|uniref:Release factor glutamine methyltransferase n=2 Tax=Selenomonas TaxID=970 RepID=A0A1I3HQZ6_SELRU|nr:MULTISPECIES: peptide chain release factor N(5)-glutamine methyltransferase [Selenomonas]MBQ1889362.1 peptide chain release factor N(5)-glutamine methyltransferase [Selenomonas sp.]TYZ29767.1 peptide chain release factor N(5)-glutamine methyltransferase [Selenomonas caprae]SFI38198.1 release factor glutamine methyltransferase [Selenomonas ruminantium]
MADSNQIWTIGRILKWTEQYFEQKGVESPRLDAEVLLSHLLDKQRIYLYVHFDEPLQAEELAAYREMVKQRVNHVPVAYIIGEREFMGLTFKVTPDTLVPRPDTEILVQAAVERLKAMPAGEVRFADIGTGTGAVCLSVLNFTPLAKADTVDISPAARAVAEENAAALGLADRIVFHTGDLLAPIKENSYAAILSNPPYIPEADIAGLAPEVRCKEPLTALSGGTDGLDFYRRLCQEAPAMLVDGGFMAFEVGIHQAQDVAALAAANPLIGRTEIIKDYAGIERVVVAWRQAE